MTELKDAVRWAIATFIGSVAFIAVVALLTGVALWLSGIPDRYAACDDLGGRMARSACVLPDGQYVDPLVYKGGREVNVVGS